MADLKHNADAPPVRRAMGAIQTIQHALRIDTRSLEQQLGMSRAQLLVLHQLADRRADSINELAERTQTDQSSVSVVVRRLVQRGYVARVPSVADRRRVELAATPTGTAIIKAATPAVFARLSTAVRQMPVDEQRELADLLERWARAADIDLITPRMLADGEAEVREPDI